MNSGVVFSSQPIEPFREAGRSESPWLSICCHDPIAVMRLQIIYPVAMLGWWQGLRIAGRRY